jgi:hypothetical protein
MAAIFVVVEFSKLSVMSIICPSEFHVNNCESHRIDA